MEWGGAWTHHCWSPHTMNIYTPYFYAVTKSIYRRRSLFGASRFRLEPMTFRIGSMMTDKTGMVMEQQLRFTYGKTRDRRES